MNCSVRSNPSVTSRCVSLLLLLSTDVCSTGDGIPHSKVQGEMVTTINFVCNASAPVDSKPTLLDPEAFTPKDTSLIDKCSLVLDWQTPYACGPTETPCVAEDTSGNSYDLSSLIRRDSNWLVRTTDFVGDTIYQLNVCRSLVPIASDRDNVVAATACNGAPNSGCVLTRAPHQPGNPSTAALWKGRSLGKAASPQWDVANNHLVVVYKTAADPAVCSNGESTTVIEFGCPLTPAKGSPQLVSEDSVNCKYKFVWFTSAACPVRSTAGGANSSGWPFGQPTTEADPDAPIECTVTDPTTQDHYDLSYLSNARRNWVADDEREGGKYIYEMNVCAPLVGGSNECEGGVGSCQINAGDEGHKSLGVSSAPLIDENGQLYLNFSGGTACIWGGNGNNRSTRVDMQCPRDQNGDILPGVLGHPTFIEEDENCGYHFEWATSFACPVVPSHQKDCKVVDLIGGDEYDFTALQKPEESAGYTYSVVIGKGGGGAPQDLSFNICGNVTCGGSDAGACIGGVSLGNSNRAPYFDNGAKYLQYEIASLSSPQASGLKGIGLNCKSGSKFSTRIEFACDPEMKDGAAPAFTLIEASGCSAIVSLATLEACEQPKNLVECITTDKDTGYTYDLSSLGRTGTNWIALDGREGNKYEYEINVCRSLAHVPNNHKGCVGFAACQVSRKDGFAEKGLGVSDVASYNNAHRSDHLLVFARTLVASSSSSCLPLPPSTSTSLEWCPWCLFGGFSRRHPCSADFSCNLTFAQQYDVTLTTLHHLAPPYRSQPRPRSTRMLMAARRWSFGTLAVSCAATRPGQPGSFSRAVPGQARQCTSRKQARASTSLPGRPAQRAPSARHQAPTLAPPQIAAVPPTVRPG